MRIIIEFDQQIGQPTVSTAPAESTAPPQTTALSGGAAVGVDTVPSVGDGQGIDGGSAGGEVATALSGGAAPTVSAHQAIASGGVLGGLRGSGISGSGSTPQDGGVAPQIL